MLTVIKDGEKRFLTSWEYNACRIFAALRSIAADQGDTVKPASHTVTIINRSELEERRALADRIEFLRKLETGKHQEATDQAIAKYEQQISAPYTEPELEVPAATWVEYKHKGKYIYFQMDENPFFPFYYIKTRITEDNQRSIDACLDELPKDWFFDNLLRKGASNEDIKQAAAEIYEALDQAPDSEIYVDIREICVPNTYDGGWHKERARQPERKKALDF